MAYKNKKDRRKAWRRYYYNHKEQHRKRRKMKRKTLKKWFSEYKATLVCADCGFSFKDHPYVCDFHHVGIKKMQITVMVNEQFSKEKIMKEISKCVPLCANCHRIRTHNEQKE